MIRHSTASLIVVAATLFMSACSSTRFAGLAPAPSPRPARPQVVEPIEEPAVSAVPSQSVTSEPLPPPPGTGPTPVPGPVVTDVQPGAGAPPPVQPRVEAPAQVASAAPSRSSAVGGWTAKDATGASCRVQLSSAPSLDLYKASAPGCANKDLAKVTAWDFRDGDVYLYQQGGTVTARLRSAGGALEGALSKSGAPLTLVR